MMNRFRVSVIVLVGIWLVVGVAVLSPPVRAFESFQLDPSAVRAIQNLIIRETGVIDNRQYIVGPTMMYYNNQFVDAYQVKMTTPYGQSLEGLFLVTESTGPLAEGKLTYRIKVSMAGFPYKEEVAEVRYTAAGLLVKE